MAHFKLLDFIEIGCGARHTAVSWQVASDENFDDIIDESLEDTENLWEWHSMLPKSSGGYHADLDELYLRVKVHIDDNVSPWYVVGPANQNLQMITINALDETQTVVSSTDINMQ